MDNPQEPITVLSLCSGGAGLDLGLKLAIPSARTICWAEWEAFAVAELVRRMEEGELDAAPVFTDVRRFDGKPWRGVVDCIVGGFPCQPHSTAGKRRGEDDERNLWPDVRRIVEEVRPSLCFFENVPGLVSVHGGRFFRTLLEDLERLGFQVATGLFTAAEVGASHKRERLFILGVADGERPRRAKAGSGRQEHPGREPKQGCGTLADDPGRGCGELRPAPGGDGRTEQDGGTVEHATSNQGWIHGGPRGKGSGTSDARGGSGELADTTSGPAGGGPGDMRVASGREESPSGFGTVVNANSQRLEGRGVCGNGHTDERTAGPSVVPLFPPGPGDRERWAAILRDYPHYAPATPQPDLRLLADGLATDRSRYLRMLGNGVVPLCAAYAFAWLWRALGEADA